MAEILYNGLKLPEPWPVSLSLDSLSEPHTLLQPPDIININTGRQLFVDDFLIETTDMKKTFYTPEHCSNNPVLFPEKEWEKRDDIDYHAGPSSMVFSDGVWYDSNEKLFKIWYLGGFLAGTCYAVSQDGIKWEKPVLDVVSGTNIVHTAMRDSATVWLDVEEKDEKKKYKFFAFELEGSKPTAWGNLSVYFSGDGIHWGEKILQTGTVGDRTTVFYNPFRKVWVYSVRDFIKNGPGRFRRYYETKDIFSGSYWEKDQLPVWVGSDRLDFIREDLKTRCQLYNLDCVAYESILLGLFSIWRGQPQDRPKICEICTGFSRDGFFWHRPDRRSFIGVSENSDDYNWGNVQSAGGCCLIVKDKLCFYFSARRGVPGTPKSGICTTNLAMLRRDGFASMDADEKQATLLTRKLVFSGKYLFVNVNTKNGELKVEVLDENNHVIEPFSKDNCVPVCCDSTSIQVRWKNADKISSVTMPVKFKFYVKNGQFFSFWVSKHASGQSDGFVAAGGPGFETNRDT